MLTAKLDMYLQVVKSDVLLQICRIIENRMTRLRRISLRGSEQLVRDAAAKELEMLENGACHLFSCP